MVFEAFPREAMGGKARAKGMGALGHWGRPKGEGQVGPWPADLRRAAELCAPLHLPLHLGGLAWLLAALALAPARAGAQEPQVRQGVPPSAAEGRADQPGVAPPTFLPGFFPEPATDDEPVGDQPKRAASPEPEPEAPPPPAASPPPAPERPAPLVLPATQPTVAESAAEPPTRPPPSQPAAAPAPAAVPQATSSVRSAAVAVDVAPAAASSGEACSAFNQLQGLCEASAEAEAPRPWRLFAQSAFVWNVVRDDDPANDAGAAWLLGGEVDLPVRVAGAFATAFVGLSQSFNPEPDESPVQPLDSLVAVGYRHSVGLDALGLPGKSALLIHRAGAFVPTSRRSRRQSLYVAADWLTAGRFFLGHGTMAGFNLRTQYRFHQYAERAGLQGGLNERWNVQASLLARQTVWSDARLGQVLAQGSTGTRYRLRYPSRAGFESETSDRAPRFQDWTWGLGLIYVPTPHLNVSLAVGQDTALRQQGFVRADFADREELEWTLALTANL